MAKIVESASSHALPNSSDSWKSQADSLIDDARANGRCHSTTQIRHQFSQGFHHYSANTAPTPEAHIRAARFSIHHDDPLVARWAVLGTGLGSRIIAETLPRCTNCRLVLVGSRSQVSTAAKWGISMQYVRSYEHVVNADNVDVIYIGLPTALKFEWAQRACAVGNRVVVVDKPFSSFDDVEKLRSRCSSTCMFVKSCNYLVANTLFSSPVVPHFNSLFFIFASVSGSTLADAAAFPHSQAFKYFSGERSSVKTSKFVFHVPSFKSRPLIEPHRSMPHKYATPKTYASMLNLSHTGLLAISDIMLSLRSLPLQAILFQLLQQLNALHTEQMKPQVHCLKCLDHFLYRATQMSEMQRFHCRFQIICTKNSLSSVKANQG